MARKEKAPKTGLTTKHWFGYMFGDWGGCMTFTLMASIFGLYCTNVLGINPTLMGTLTLIWTIWDAINDPMMGALMDKAFAKNQNKRGKFRPWLLRATPLLAISAICLWTVPTFLEGIPMLIALFSFKILYEASYTMFNIPMGSLLSAMSTNDSERASLSSARGVGSMIGNMIPAMAGPIIIGLWDDRTSTGYMITGVTCAIIGFIICFLHYALTEERTEGSIYGTFNLSRRIGQAIGSGFAFYALAWIGYDGTAAVQSAGTVVGLKALCVLVPAVFILGSWAAFKFVWNITPEVRAQMAAMKLAAKTDAE